MKQIVLGTCCLAILLSLGCGGGKPKRVDAPTIDADGAAAEAMNLYDTDKNGKIEKAELDATPSMKSVLSSLDTNGDGGIDKNEIATRIKAWQASKVGLSCPQITFTFKGKPVKSGEVVLTPEPFLGPNLKEAKGSINDGNCSPSSEGNIDNLPGMAYGFYTITIQNAQPSLPADKKWGIEISDQNPVVQETGGSYPVDLSAK
ncbi:MAG: EF-hand domain-containing protein [Planctomycetia bacterium]|nr:EF-hand domain-containing protein [Planctomycetia bacterium]